MSLITEMAFHGQWDALLEVLRQSPERVNEASEGKGYAPLHQAAWHGASLSVIGELLSLGADTRRVTLKKNNKLPNRSLSRKTRSGVIWHTYWPPVRYPCPG